GDPPFHGRAQGVLRRADDGVGAAEKLARGLGAAAHALVHRLAPWSVHRLPGRAQPLQERVAVAEARRWRDLDEADQPFVVEQPVLSFVARRPPGRPQVAPAFLIARVELDDPAGASGGEVVVAGAEGMAGTRIEEVRHVAQPS